ncbi:MAG: hypothetical protein JO159_19675 [Acidobacteria bacterium]|nr:hypothetical protein [Acidobacteriota bacterium]
MSVRLLNLPFPAIGLAAFAVVAPFFWLGIPSGHDFEFHFNSWIEVLNHWKQGVLYPHWAVLAHYDYGEARFIFYPPISWTIGAALGALLPWPLVPGAYIVIALVFCGCSMYLLARSRLSRSQALDAAMFYLANPYLLVIVYWRSAMAELLAAAYLPLLLLYLWRLEENGGRALAPLSWLLALGWLTNIPSAVIMNYSLAVIALTIAIRRRSPATLVSAALAVFLGAALAAIYLVPAFHEQKWVNLAQVLAPGVRPLDNFLFTLTEDQDHNRFNRLISLVAITETIMVAAMLYLSRGLRRQELWRSMLLWSLLAIALMFRPTLGLWNYLPELRFVQLPWRWLLCLNVPFALGLVVAFHRPLMRMLIYAVAVTVLLIGWQRVQQPWWDSSADLREMVDNQHEGIGNEGTDEYVPAGADPYDIDRNAPEARFQGNGSARIKMDRWLAEKRLLAVDTTAPGILVLRLFNYPLWKVKDNGQDLRTETRPHTGEMLIPLRGGENHIRIAFVNGWDRGLGALISALAVVAIEVMRRRFRSAVPRAQP